MCGFKHMNSELPIPMCYAHGYEEFAIAQHEDTLRYATICGGGYQPPI